MQCPLTLEKFQGSPNPNLTRFTFSECNQAAQRLEFIDLILATLEQSHESPPWYNLESKTFNFEIITHRFGVPRSIGLEAPPDCRLIENGVFNLNGLHGGYFAAFQRYIRLENRCPYRCNEVATRVFQSTYLNRYLRFGDLDYTWKRAATWIGQDLSEMAEPLTDALGECYKALIGEDGQRLSRLKMAVFSLRPLLENFRNIVQNFFFYAVMLKVALKALKRWGVQSVDGLLLKVNERIHTMMEAACASFFIESIYSVFASDKYRIILDMITILLIVQLGFSKVLKSGLILFGIALLVLPQIIMVLRAQAQEEERLWQHELH